MSDVDLEDITGFKLEDDIAKSMRSLVRRNLPLIDSARAWWESHKSFIAEGHLTVYDIGECNVWRLDFTNFGRSTVQSVTRDELYTELLQFDHACDVPERVVWDGEQVTEVTALSLVVWIVLRNAVDRPINLQGDPAVSPGT